MPGQFVQVEVGGLREVEWERKSCVLAWDTLGIWSKDYCIITNFLDNETKEFDINSISISQDKHVIAVADTLGPIRILYYPACSPG